MELIQISQNEMGEFVDARELHKFLGAGRVFSSWIIGRIEEYEFENGSDYFTSVSDSTERDGGKDEIVYSLTIEMAKELAMIEGGKSGMKIRRYLIAREKRMRDIERQLYKDLEEKVSEHSEHIKFIDEKRKTLASDLSRAFVHINENVGLKSDVGYYMNEINSHHKELVQETRRLWQEILELKKKVNQ